MVPKEKRSFGWHFNNVKVLYGPRNKIWNDSRNARCNYLLFFLREAAELIRKGCVDKTQLAIKFATAFGWACSTAETYGQLAIIRALCRKYPLGRCTFCRKKVCRCPPRRNREAALAKPSRRQMAWPLDRWCQVMGERYGKKNFDQYGLYGSCLRLVCEAIEVLTIDIREKKDRRAQHVDTVQEFAAGEFADVFAWIFVMVHMLDIVDEFTRAVTLLYAGKCPRCNGRPCNCGEVSLMKLAPREVLWKEMSRRQVKTLLDAVKKAA